MLATAALAPLEPCPLCQSELPDPGTPRTAGDAIALLGEHFGTACPATAFIMPRLPP